MASALPVQTMRGKRGSAAEERITGVPQTPVSSSATPAVPKAPAPQPTIPAASTEQKILANLNEGWKNAKDKFTDRSTFDSAYGYSNKTPEQRAVLDSFWSSKKGSEVAPIKPEVAGAGNLTQTALNVVDKGSQSAFNLPAVAAAEKAHQLLEDQDTFNKQTLANLEASTSPILAQTREQYKQFTDLISQTKNTYAEKIAGLKDLRANQDQEIDINKGGQIQAMRANMAAKGITGEAADAAIAQASYDPKYIKAANDVKKQYLLDITAASDKLGEIITGLTNNQTSLTAAEASVLKSIQVKKEELDKAVKDIKDKATESSFAPIETYAKGKTDAAQANDVTNYDVRAEQALWEKSDAVTRKATLQRKLFSEQGGAAERGLISTEDYDKAAKMGSFAEGQAYLESIIASKKQSNAVGLSSAANPNQDVNKPIGRASAEIVSTTLSRYATASKEVRNQIKDKIKSFATPAEWAVWEKQFEMIDATNPTADVSTGADTTTNPVSSPKTPLPKGWTEDADKNRRSPEAQKALDDSKYVENSLKKSEQDRQVRIDRTKQAIEIATPIQKALLITKGGLLNFGKISNADYDKYVDTILNPKK